VKSHPDVGRKGKKKYSVISNDPDLMTMFKVAPYMHYDENSFRSFAFSAAAAHRTTTLRMSLALFFGKKINVDYLVIFP
jgi:hypothetical protein